MKKILLAAIACTLVGNNAFSQTNSFPPDGNVGIGVTNPWARLDVRTNGTNGGDQGALNLNNPSNDPYATVSLTMGLSNVASSVISVQRNNATKGSSLFFHTSDVNGVPQPRMWISDYGNVGIGTLSPAFPLHTKGNNNQGYLLNLETNGSFAGMFMQTPSASKKLGMHFLSDGFQTNSLRFARYATTGDAWGSGWEANPITFDLDAPDGSVVLSETGNLGLGTYSPYSRLHIKEDQNLIALTLESSSAGWGSGMSLKNTSASGKAYGIYSSAWGSLNFTDQASGADRMIIAPNGNIGIGTTGVSDVAFKLVVEGGVRARKVKVDQQTWADSVFHYQYKLPSIYYVENFIKQNNHLPDIPSEKEVKENGVDLSEMNKLLLLKIEELTLYTIDQQKQIDQKNKEMQEMGDRLNKLEELMKKIEQRLLNAKNNP